MEFDIGTYCSSALRQYLREKGIINKPTFSLPINKHPIFEYLDFLRVAHKEVYFTREFHVGCSDDDRPPNIIYSSKKQNGDEVLYFYAKQQIHNGIFWKSNYFHDSEGRRDLDAVSEAYNNPLNTHERLVIGWRGPENLLGAGSGEIMTGGSFEIDFADGVWNAVSGLDYFYDRELRNKEIERAVFGRFIEGTDSPFNRADVKAVIVDNCGMTASDFLKTGLTLSDAVGEATKIMWPKLRVEASEEKAMRDKLFANVQINQEIPDAELSIDNA
ncbi:Uncharacterised protein [uncultured archaeon]|nr:Uncharacterised protein [uncultured archaeon]